MVLVEGAVLGTPRHIYTIGLHVYDKNTIIEIVLKFHSQEYKTNSRNRFQNHFQIYGW